MSVDPNSIQYANDLLVIAIKAGASTDQINKIMEMRESARVQEARKKYLKALSDFQHECPVLKNKTTVVAVGAKGGSRSYKYSTLSDITQEIKPILYKHGLVYRWEVSLNDANNNMISCSCIVSHVDGYYEETTISAEVDSSSLEVKNKIQQRGSTISYLHRLTLKSALGITTGDEDDISENKNAIKEVAQDANISSTSAATKIPPSVVVRDPIPNEDYVRIVKDVASFTTERQVMDYYYSWESKYGNSLVFRNMLRKKISFLPPAARFTKEEKDAYKKPENLVVYE